MDNVITKNIKYIITYEHFYSKPLERYLEYIYVCSTPKGKIYTRVRHGKVLYNILVLNEDSKID